MLASLETTQVGLDSGLDIYSVFPEVMGATSIKSIYFNIDCDLIFTSTSAGACYHAVAFFSFISDICTNKQAQ